jgi:hypothetical protein
MKLLDRDDSIKLYNLLASLEDEYVEEGIAEPHEIILVYNGRLFRKILKKLSREVRRE